MPPIQIKQKKKTENGWSFVVEVGEGEDVADYTVELNKEYYEKLTAGREDPEELVRRAFEFLLQREPKESILSQFSLEDINRYFPEFESEISG